MQNGTHSKSSWSFLILEKRSFKSSFLLWSYRASFAAISWARCTWQTVLDWLTKQSSSERRRRARALFQHRGTNSPFFLLLLHECKFDMVKMVLRVPRSWTKGEIKKILIKSWNSLEQTVIFWRLLSFFIDCFYYLLLVMNRATKIRGNL